ncbi:MAG: hypothetical protein GY722_10185, partial [bacterium]|nr:hypothetical protein [bacterium]
MGDIQARDSLHRMTPGHQLRDKIKEGHARYVKSKRRPPKSYPSNRASEMGHPCERYLVLNRTKGEVKEPPDDTLQLIFEEGNQHETQVKAVLNWMGIEIYGSQMEFPQNAYGLTGHVDGVIGQRENGNRVIIEIKGLNGAHWQSVKEDDDGASLKHHSAWFVQKWYYQGQLYAFLDDIEEIVWIIKNKWTGEWKVVVMPIDYEAIQGCTDKADRVNEHVEAGTEPEPLNDPVTCRRCPYYDRACHPSIENPAGLMIITNEAACDLAEEAAEIDFDRKRYNAAYKSFRDY